MTEINLLPDDMRRPGATPPRTLAVLVAAAALGTGSLAVLVYLFFDVHAAARNRVDIADEQMANLAPQQKYAQSLEKEKGEFTKRNQTIQQIAESRVVWTRKLDRVSAVVNKDIETDRHQVWLNNLAISGGGSKGSSEYSVKLSGFCSGNEVAGVSNFHEDLQNDAGFATGFGFSAPTARLEPAEPEYQPPRSMSFNFEAVMEVQSSKKRKSRKKR